jgi:hypothetical protein
MIENLDEIVLENVKMFHLESMNERALWKKLILKIVSVPKKMCGAKKWTKMVENSKLQE